MVGETMIDSYTTMENFKASDGNAIIYNINCVFTFLTQTIEENYINLSDEEKIESFYIGHEYGDLLAKLVNAPIGEVRRNPKEEFENFNSIPRDDNVSEHVYNIKLERLRLNKEWFESQNN
jgi:hypothetical protein